MTVFFHTLFYSTLVPMFTVLDPLLEFTYHLLLSWRKFALCIQSLLCMLFLFGWPTCQRSDMILMEVTQHAHDMIHYISGLFGYFYVCEIYVNLIWYLYLFMLNKFCLVRGPSSTFVCRHVVGIVANILIGMDHGDSLSFAPNSIQLVIALPGKIFPVIPSIWLSFPHIF